jgi:hypothetical protein
MASPLRATCPAREHDSEQRKRAAFCSATSARQSTRLVQHTPRRWCRADTCDAACQRTGPVGAANGKRGSEALPSEPAATRATVSAPGSRTTQKINSKTRYKDKSIEQRRHCMVLWGQATPTMRTLLEVTDDGSASNSILNTRAAKHAAASMLSAAPDLQASHPAAAIPGT